jgi:hypothetical protein
MENDREEAKPGCVYACLCACSLVAEVKNSIPSMGMSLAKQKSKWKPRSGSVGVDWVGIHASIPSMG